MKAEIKVITLGVNDLEKSLAFYRDGMGRRGVEVFSRLRWEALGMVVITWRFVLSITTFPRY